MRKGETAVAPEADRVDGCAHPRNVFSLIGHEHAEAKLAQQFDTGRFHHAWLISGPKGVGKATLAYRLIRTVLGGQPQTQGRLDVPATDPVAQRLQSLGHGDFLLIRRPADAKTGKLRSEIPIAEVRKISKFFSKKPAEGGWRVCLIDSVDEMNRNATNALLKTLEEPPKHSLIILLSNAPGRLLPTIRSRCMALSARPMDAGRILEWLPEQGQFDERDMCVAAELCGGAPGTALALLNNQTEVLNPLRSLLDEFPNPAPTRIHTVAERLSAVRHAHALPLFWDVLDRLYAAQAVYSATGDWDLSIPPMAKSRPTQDWLDLRQEAIGNRRALDGLNMDKKTVLLQTLTQFCS